MSKQEWIAANLKKNEEYAGVLLGYNSEPDYHVVVSAQDIDVEHSDAVRLAQSNGADLPTVREVMHIYVNRPELFADNRRDAISRELVGPNAAKQFRDTYWTKELCPPPSNCSSAQRQQTHLVACAPSVLGKELVNFFNGTPSTLLRPSSTVRYSHNVMVVRRIPVNPDSVMLDPNHAVAAAVAWLTVLEEALQRMHYRREGSKSDFSSTTLAQSNIFEWYGKYRGKDSAQRFRISVTPADTSTGLSKSAWAGALLWSIHIESQSRLFKFHSGNSGIGLPTETLKEEILSTLKMLHQEA